MKQDNFKLDPRNVEDIQKQIKNLAAGYVPEWNFTTSNPDIGSVLALIFANQMGKNVNRFNNMLERYRTELVNLMEISPLPAKPAETTILMNVASEADEGVNIPKGSKFLADSEDGKIVFETAFPVYLTPSKLRTMFMTSGDSGKIVPLKGELKKKSYIDTETTADVKDEDTQLEPFSLFQFAKEGVERQAVVLYHSNIFDVEEETIYCRIKGSPGFLKKIENGEFRFLYYSEEGFIPIENCRVMGKNILLVKNKPNKPVMIKNYPYSVFVLEAKEPQIESIFIESISFSSAGNAMHVPYVGNGTTDYKVECFHLFGDTLSLFAECYIGFDHYFSKKGARISLDFHGSFRERYVGLSRQEEIENLKIIKRKPRAAAEEVVSYAKPEEISIEYFNGIGWKRLECDKEYSRIFAEVEEADYRISFICPKDWEASSIGAYSGRTLRIQLLRADNCYYQPCFHQVPIISDLKVSYSYEDNFMLPELGKVFCGTEVVDITNKILNGEKFTAFSKGSYNDTALYLGFDHKFEKGPVSLWWQIEGVQRSSNYNLRFYYSTIHGFKEMKVIDYTSNLSRSGIMMFLPPADMAVTRLEGRRCCWLKIVNADGGEFQQTITVQQIFTNGVIAHNIETLEIQEFYLEDVETSLVFPLRAKGILDAEVWVNETNEYTQEMMEQMAVEMPDKVRMERNYLGEISDFYVKWDETKQFYATKPEDRHYILDRLNGRIMFGNGVQVRVPQNTDGVAFMVQLRCCNGSQGNVPAGAVTDSSSNWLFVQDIYNPKAAFGGSDMETLERALQRGASFFSSRGRFVTEKDYEREILHFSDNIDKVSIVSGAGRDGSFNERMLNIVLLMKDCVSGSESFIRIQSELKKHLLEHCELAINPKELLIQEPIFVELNVDIWGSVLKMEDSFEMQNAIINTLNEYLNPISGMKDKGWNIGVLPRKSQILMRLNSLKIPAVIQHMVITAKYEDNAGIHEVDIEDLRKSPYMVVMNGKHHVYISTSEEK